MNPLSYNLVYIKHNLPISTMESKRSPTVLRGAGAYWYETIAKIHLILCETHNDIFKAVHEILLEELSVTKKIKPDFDNLIHECSECKQLRVEKELLIERLNKEIGDADDFQCRIASALGWLNDGVPFVTHVENLVAENKRLKAELDKNK